MSIAEPGPAPPFDLAFRRRLNPFELEVTFQSTAARIGLVGPSGSGKSTLLRVLAGVDREARGRVSVDGEPWQSAAPPGFRPPWMRAVGWVPQDVLLFPHLSVQENLGFARRNGDGASLDELRALANALDIEDLLARRASGISGGERQRVALGRALLAQPRVLLLDEPFVALDESLKERVVACLVERVQQKGLRVVLATHDVRGLDTLVQDWRSVTNGVVASL